MRITAAGLFGGFVLLGLCTVGRADGPPPDSEALPPEGQQVFAGVAGFLDRASGELHGSGPGVGVELGYDFFFTPSQAIGLLADTAVDLGSYGDDGDSMSWRELALRYTYAFPELFTRTRLIPFLSAGAAIGRTGGEIHEFRTLKSLMFDAGVAWRAAHHVSLLLRLTERPAWISSPSTWRHNAAGAILDVAFVL